MCYNGDVKFFIPERSAEMKAISQNSIYENPLPRPRDRTSVEFASLRKTVLGVIEELEQENANL